MPAVPTRARPPGWYADPRGEVPEDEQAYRWWDGEAWTAWLSQSEAAPRPRGAVTRVEPVPVLTEPRPPHWFRG